MSNPRKSVIVVKHERWEEISVKNLNDEPIKTLVFKSDVSVWTSLTKLCKSYGWNETALLQKKMPFNHEGFTIERQLIQGI